MENKEYYIESINREVWGYNTVWDKPMTESPLVTNSLESAEQIRDYCKALLIIKKQIKENYKNNSDDIKLIVNTIIGLCNDGRDFRAPVERGDRKLPFPFISHINEDGLLPIEKDLNDNGYTLKRIISSCESLIEVIKSEESTVDFNDFLGKILEFEGYESGTYNVLFDKITCNKNGEFRFDGLIVLFATDDSEAHGNGVLSWNVEDESFDRLPYNPCDEFEDDDIEENKKELLEWLNSKTQIGPKQLKKDIAKYAVEALDYCNPDFDYLYSLHNKE